MRRSLLIILFVGQLSTQAFSVDKDTVTNWQIYYGDQLVVKANGTGETIVLIDTIKFKSDIQFLTIRYDNHETKKTGDKIKIEIWDDKKRLDNRVFVMSPITVDIRDIITNKTKDRIIHLWIYYSDSINKKRLFGQLIVDFTRRPTFYYSTDR